MVGVGGDGEANALRFGDADERRVEIEAFGAGVDLHGDAAFGGGGGDGFKVVEEGFAVQENATGGVADGLDVGVLKAAEVAFGHLLAGEVHVAVHAGDDEIERG